jgi:hypothetical protein
MNAIDDDPTTADPYAVPAARVDDVFAVDTRADRAAHIAIEAGLRGVGVLCLVYGAVFAMVGGSMALAFEGVPVSVRGYGVALFALGVLGLASAWGYAFLRPWVRNAATALAPLVVLTTYGLTLPLVAYAGWITWSEKGRRVLSPDYAAVRAQAPQLSAWRHPFHVFWLGLMIAGYVILVSVFLSVLPSGDF